MNVIGVKKAFLQNSTLKDIFFLLMTQVLLAFIVKDVKNVLLQSFICTSIGYSVTIQIKLGVDA